MHFYVLCFHGAQITLVAHVFLSTTGTSGTLHKSLSAQRQPQLCFAVAPQKLVLAPPQLCLVVALQRLVSGGPLGIRVLGPSRMRFFLRWMYGLEHAAQGVQTRGLSTTKKDVHNPPKRGFTTHPPAVRGGGSESPSSGTRVLNMDIIL